MDPQPNSPNPPNSVSGPGTSTDHQRVVTDERPIWYVVLKDFGITTLVALACMYGFWAQLAQAATERTSATAAALAERKEMLKVLEDDRKEFRESIRQAITPAVDELKDLNKAMNSLDTRMGNVESLLRDTRRVTR